MPFEILTFESRALRNNFAGDPHVREVWVYLPPSYATSNRRFPVLYCLPAFGSTGAQIAVGNPWSPGMVHRFDTVIGAGAPEVIAVFPNCFTRFGGSQYLNSVALGSYEDYVCDELVPFVDTKLRTLASRDSRAVFGHSSGGYGALCLSMKRPEVFGAFACHSGDMGFAFCYVPDFANCADHLIRAGSIETWVERFDARAKKCGSDFDVVNVLAMAAAYSPNLELPHGLELPFDLGSGELSPQVWQRWQSHDPVNMAGGHADALRSMRLAFFDCGTRDELHLHLGLQLMHRRLNEIGVPHELETFDDGHRSLGYRHDIVIPKLASALCSN
ncbi:MAG: hypothetical protein A2341_19430 [Deltaproteobacteria bacterium RIFOXYB12_FULL_58_9]|nr:MAG: hypothetical protein A2341_19430 [Deltaproteobacteria bacterium RIFOXYB12_FULL_58_9]